MHHFRALLPVTLTLLLAACGGTGPTPTPPTPPAPPVVTPTPPVTTPTEPDTSDDIEILEYETIDGEYSDRGVGIIKNNGTENIYLVKLSVTYYDAADRIVANEFGFADLKITQPSETSPFMILLSSFPSAAERYEIFAEWFQTDEVPIRALTVT